MSAVATGTHDTLLTGPSSMLCTAAWSRATGNDTCTIRSDSDPSHHSRTFMLRRIGSSRARIHTMLRSNNGRVDVRTSLQYLTCVIELTLNDGVPAVSEHPILF